MHIHRILRLACLLLFASSAVAGNNVLLIIADDFGLDASAVYNTAPGVQLAPTPNIASLAANGVKFTNAYSYTVCSPARSSVLTGRFGSRTGTANVAGGPASNNGLKATEFTLPDAFAANAGLNYQLKHVGKWHLGGANTAPCLIGGWPSFSGPLIGEIDDYMNWTKVTGSGASASSSTVTTYATTDNVNDALSFISTQTAAGKPWFTWVAFNAPHTPYHKPPDNLHTYDTTVANWATLPVTGNSLVHYNAAIEAMDTEIGRLLAGVNLATTTVIFIGDNGTPPATLQAPYPANRGKATLYEGGIRVPMIIRGAGVVSPGRTSTELVHVVDLYSTILELAGINVGSTVPSGTVLDSQSLMPILQGQPGTRTRVFDDYWDLAFPSLSDAGRTLRDLQYKLVRLNDGTERFYDLNADPYEGTNLIAAGFAAMNSTRQAAYTSLATQFPDFNTPPTISGVANQSVPQGGATGALAFTVGDGELNTAILSVTASSSNTTVVPAANVVLGGSGTARTVAVTAAAGQIGTSTITLSVTDGVFTTSTSFVLSAGSPATVSPTTIAPSVPTNTDTVTVTAAVTPSGGATVSSVQLGYSTGTSTNTVFAETMAAAAANPWTGTGAVYPWTITNTGAGGMTVKQTVAANHGAGNPCGLDFSRGTANVAQSMAATTNAIDATGSAAFVEYWVYAADLVSPNGWTFQTSTDGTTWTTRQSELTGSNHAFQLFHYDLSATERVSTLRIRFQFAGNATNTPPPKVRIDDITVVTTTPNPPTVVTMFDDGAHGDGLAGDGIYGGAIPPQTTGTTVNYTVTMTDSAAGTASSSGSFQVAAAAPVLTVTPASTLTSTGTVGSGVFSPSSVTYTIANTGTGTMTWSASKSAAWVTLSSTNGTLASGANTTVTATINATANTLAIGSYSDSIAFSNTTNGTGNTTRPASLAVTTAFATWQIANFTGGASHPDAAAMLDPDKDGLVNLIEYALGTNPNSSSPNPATISKVNISGSDYIRISFTKNPAATDVTTTAQSSLDAGSWGTNGFIIESNTATELIIRETTPVGTATQRFYRALVTQ
ncbi:MAG: hypothetical protein RL088_4206 [Verrucomicrobiota bacterium]|jgi:arylsulfatase A-like enzyme